MTVQRAVSALTRLWLADTLLAAVIASLYFGDTLSEASLSTRLFAVLALLSTMGMLMLLPALVAALGLITRARRAVAGWIAVGLGAAVLLLIFVDTQIWSIFRYHINGMVLNVVTTPGGLDTFEIGWTTWVLVLGLFAALVLTRAWLWFRCLCPIQPLAPRPWARWVVLALLCTVLVEKSMYAWADLTGDRAVLALARVYPLYQPLTSKRLLQRWTGRTPSERTELELSKSMLLRYPRTAPQFAADAPRPNILIVAIDSLRADALQPAVMPYTTQWQAQGVRAFRDHVSGGNATRIGVFSLIYGVHGSYWPAIYAERTPPVLVQELERLGYDLRVLSTTSMQFPEFRSTAWVTMPDRVEDRFPGPAKWQMDEQVGARFAQWTAQRKAEQDPRPFFAFVMLDAPHQSYDWPKERSSFAPYSASIDYYKLARRPSEDKLLEIRNAYLNAVQHSDRVFGGMLEALRAQGLEDNTVIVLTGDHGEEFFEHGFFGHTSNYTRIQTHVPFLMAGPQIQPGEELRPTSHIDLAPTLLELLGANPEQRTEWAQGINLLNPPDQRQRIFCGWQEAAIEVDGGFLHVPLEGHKGLVEGLDPNWKPHPLGADFTKLHAAHVARMALEFRHFLR